MMRFQRVCVAAVLLFVLPLIPEVSAELKVDGQAILFYTDDVAIFSATRRLSRDGDPTQPAIDTRLTNQGDDVVFEPQLDASNSFKNRWGTTTVDVRGQGFLYADNPRFNHGTIRLQAVHAFSPETRMRFRYYYAPNQFLGDNEERHSGTRQLAAEELTSHIWAARIERTLTPEVEVRVLTRYGLRRYNDNFSQRNTDFWTIGPHLDWTFRPGMRLGLSYHYERGLAEGRHQPQFEDDVSYVNHYISADLDIELVERLTLLTAFHYERNNWTSGIVGDERRGAHENIYQGEVILVRRLSESMRAFIGVQRSNRKQSFEAESIKNTNVGVGLTMVF
jgi:hypothetical protein